MGKVVELNHSLIKHKLTWIRNKDTGLKNFRELVSELASLMVYEVTRDLPMEEIEIETPVAKGKFPIIAGKKIGVIPILRAGLGMLEGVLKLIPAAKVGHIGLYRDPDTLEPVEYYCKLPSDVNERELLIIDPMLATGGSASAAIEFIKKQKPLNIKFMCLIAAVEGIEKLKKDHPDIDIYTAAIDEKLNEHAYIVPGLGDAGDRLFGTK